MNKSILMILVLGLLLMATIAPFSALAMLMILVLISAFLWSLFTIWQSVIGSDAKERG